MPGFSRPFLSGVSAEFKTARENIDRLLRTADCNPVLKEFFEPDYFRSLWSRGRGGGRGGSQSKEGARRGRRNTRPRSSSVEVVN